MPLNKVHSLITYIAIMTLSIMGTKALSQKNTRVDSLHKQLLIIEDDTSKVLLLYELAIAYREIDKNFSTHYSTLLYGISKKINYKKGFALYSHILGLTATDYSKYDSAIIYFNRALAYYSENNLIKETALVYKNLGIVKDYKSDFASALNYYAQSIEKYKQINDSEGISNNYNNIAIVFQLLGEYDSAYSYFEKASVIKEKLGDEKGVALNYNNVANLKILLQEYEEALIFLDKSLLINQSIDDKRTIGYNYENYGVIKYKQEKYDEAMVYFKKALEVYEHFGMKNNISDIFKYIGQLDFKLKKHKAALSSYNKALKAKNEIGSKLGAAQVKILIAECLQKDGALDESINQAISSFNIAKGIGAKLEVKEALDFLQKTYALNKDYDNAYINLMAYNQYVDSLFVEYKNLDMGKVKTKYTLSQIQKESEILEEENLIKVIELEENQLKIKNQKTILVALFVCFAFSIMASFFYYLYTKRKNNTIARLKILNDEIHSQKRKIELQNIDLHKAHIEINEINKSLNKLVKVRTEKILNQNAKLQTYAYANSHKVKVPLEKLLNIAKVINWNDLTPSEQHEVRDDLKTSAEEIDEIIKNLNDVLMEERL